MSTRSTIAILKLDGTVSSIYCQSDGDLSWNGIRLVQYYQDVSKVKQLISLGDVYLLEPEIDIPPGVTHSMGYSNRFPGITTFFGRDGKDDDSEPSQFSSIEEYLTNGNFQQYDYVFHEKKKNWFLLNKNKLQKLLPLLAKDNNLSTDNKNFVSNAIKATKTIKLKEKIEKSIPGQNKSPSVKIKL